MKYRETIEESKEYKQKYVSSLENFIREKEKQAEEKRKEYCRDIFTDPERYRENFKKSLGWPLVNHCDDSIPNVTSKLLSEEDGYSIYRMSFEILDGVELSGVYFRMNGDGKRPLVLVQHGAVGTPELVAGIYGDTTNYNDMLQRVTRRGIDAFAPQLLLWSGQYEVPYDRGDFDARLKKLGSSITALEVYCFTRIIDYFEAQSHISTFGMIGLSYGGLYTLFTAAVDPRIKSSIASCFFNTMGCVSHGDLKYFCSSEQFDAEVVCLVYPRKLCIELGEKDTIFDYNQGLKLFEKINELSEKVGTDWIRLESFDGDHEFCNDDLSIERMIKDISC